MRAKILRLVIGTLVGLIMIEVGLQLVPRSLMPKEFRILDRVYTGRVKWQEMMVGDRRLGYRYRDGLDVDFPSEGRTVDIRTTSHGLGDIGFRDIGTKPPFDVVTIGDSFTFCDDVTTEDCWVRHLAEKSGLSIATLGVSGFSTLAEARVLEDYGTRLAPRVVILGIFPNDFNDNIEFDAWTSSDTENFWVWRGQREGRGPVFRWLADNSVILRLFDGAFRTKGRHSYTYSEGDVDFIFQPWWLEPMDEERRAHRQQGWALMRKAIEQIRATTERIGAELMIVTIPTKEEVYWEVARESLPDFDKLEVDRPFGPVLEYCGENGLHCCDIKPALQAEAEQGRQLYLRISSHWNALGNQVGAAAMNQCMREFGLAAGGGPA